MNASAFPYASRVDSGDHQAAGGRERPRALVVDDDVYVLSLVSVVVEDFGYEVRSASSGTAAIAEAEEFDPDVILIDLDLGPGPNGVEVIEHIWLGAPWVAAVLVSSHPSPALATDMSSHKYRDKISFVVKSDLTDSSLLQATLENAIAGQQVQPFGDSSGLISLTQRQAVLLRLLSEGLSNEAIARAQDCSTRAVERSLARLYSRLGIESSPDINQRVTAVAMYRDARVTTK